MLEKKITSGKLFFAVVIVFENHSVGQKRHPCPQNFVFKTTLYRYFFHVTMRRSQIYTRTIKISLYSDFWYFGPFTFEFPIKTDKTYQYRKYWLQCKQKHFWNQVTSHNKMGTCITWYIDPTHWITLPVQWFAAFEFNLSFIVFTVLWGLIKTFSGPGGFRCLLS